MRTSKDETPLKPCSENEQLSLLANEVADLDAAQRLARQALKLQLADHARLMQDNQRVLDTSTADDRALRQQRHRFREGQLTAMQKAQGIEFPKDDEMGDINVDSPKTTNHYYPPPPSPANGSGGLLKKALPWLLAAGLALGGAGAAWMLKPGAPTSTSTTERSGFLIELVQPK